MAESYLSTERDVRTFGDQQLRLLSDLNRPDLADIVTSYLQDAMRWYARKPFFFSDTDNTSIAGWVAATYYPQGSVIVETIGGTQYIIVALSTGLSTGVKPTFPSTLFTVPTSGFPPPVTGTAGTVDENSGSNLIRWATVAIYTAGLWTQLSTVYATNQYTPPIDYVAPRVVEITIGGNLRVPLDWRPYEALRSYDVIRPSPAMAYPAWWSFYQQQIYTFPYPNGFYPLTLSYRTAPTLARQATDTNFWTTKAEALIRNYAAYLIQLNVLHDESAASDALKAAKDEEVALRSQAISQTATSGVPASDW